MVSVANKLGSLESSLQEGQGLSSRSLMDLIEKATSRPTLCSGGEG